MRIAIGADHAGQPLKELLSQRLQEAGHRVIDVGTSSVDPVDYPDFARKVSEAVLLGHAERGIMLGGTGQGEAIAPNKFPGIRAAVCHDTYSARLSREHNDANVLAMGARVIGPELAWDVVQAWLGAGFTSVERHAHRLAKIASWERERRFPLFELARHGQSVWYDYIRRSLLASGELRRLIREGLSGVTSNPTIFEKAIAGSSDYEEPLRTLVSQGQSPSEIFQALALADIRVAAEQLRPVYEMTEGRDGFVSLELPPELAHDAMGSVAAAKRLWRALGTENVMIKVPGTPAGMQAIEELTAEGVNVNVTLLFSIDSYQAAAAAYIRGLESLAGAGRPLAHVASVASFFVSRIDTAIDALLEGRARSAPAEERAEIEGLLGRAAIANAKLAYQTYKGIFAGPRWEALSRRGARRQRVLWGSTGTKNPKYRDVLYMEELIGPDTINTVPPATLSAFMDHGYVRLSLEEGVDEARRVLEALSRHGIDLNAVTQRLQDEGVQAFADSYTKLLEAIAERREELLKGSGSRQSADLGALRPKVEDVMRRLKEERLVQRIWDLDNSLWKAGDPDHARIISDRLGWLSVVEEMQDDVPALTAFAREVRDAGFDRAVLLGMGGSSLAPEVMACTLGVAPGYPSLTVLDTTDPATILEIERQGDLGRTLFIVSSKSGTTTETLAYYRYFWKRVSERKGDRAAENFVAITDAGTPLEQLARSQGFRAVFTNPPDIGGRYSALSYFGLVPAALIGAGLAELLDHADRMVHACAAGVPIEDNPGVFLGTVLGALALEGRDKVTIALSPGISTFGCWAEQLLAESTGKEGMGLVPVEGEPLGGPEVYGDDRVFVHLRLDGDPKGDLDRRMRSLAEAGHPVVTLRMKSATELGAEFFRWEFATAVAAAVLGINPFDEPNVQESKDNTNRVLSELRAAGGPGTLPEPAPGLSVGGVAVYGSVEAAGPEEALRQLLQQTKPEDYFCLMAYLPASPALQGALSELRERVRDATGAATTLGFGPRFLHSTGQLHKGGPNTGVYLQITADDDEDVPVPGEVYTFGTLKQAQALGDFHALQQHGSRVIRIHFAGGTERAVSGIRRLAEAVAGRAVARR